MKELIIATNNPGKLKEIKQLLRDLEILIKSAKEIGITQEAIEDGKTFEENAIKKARLISPLVN